MISSWNDISYIEIGYNIRHDTPIGNLSGGKADVSCLIQKTWIYAWINRKVFFLVLCITGLVFQ